MKRLILLFSLFAALLLAAVPPALAQDKIVYKDPKKGVVEANGTIVSESISKVEFKPNFGANKQIDAGEITDIVYLDQLKTPAVRKDYVDVVRREGVADRATTQAAERKKILAEVLAEYQKMAPKVAGVKFVEPHFQYKIGSLLARLAGDDKEKIKAAIVELDKFKTANPNAWQVTNCVRSLAQLYADTGDYAKAAGAFDEMIKLPGVTKEMKWDYQMMAADYLLRADKHAEAGVRLGEILKVMNKSDPQYPQLQMRFAVVKAKSGKVLEAEKELLSIIENPKTDKNRIALAYNTLGDCYMEAKQPKAALYQYMYVDQVYYHEKGEHLRAVTQLEKVFKLIGEEAMAKEYAAKIDKLKSSK